MKTGASSGVRFVAVVAVVSPRAPAIFISGAVARGDPLGLAREVLAFFIEHSSAIEEVGPSGMAAEFHSRNFGRLLIEISKNRGLVTVLGPGDLPGYASGPRYIENLIRLEPAPRSGCEGQG